MESFVKFGLFSNLEEVLNFLNKPEYKDIKEVNQLLEAYNNARIQFDKCNETKKYPLIVLEGLDGCGKTSLSKKIANKINGIRCVTPPESIKVVRDYFDKNANLRSAFYCLGNYIAALEISCILTKQPVVLDRFWHSTIAFALGEAVCKESKDLPSNEDHIYIWPYDLLRPDKVVFVTVSEHIRLERHGRRNAASVTEQEALLNHNSTFRKSIIEAYMRMREPAVTKVSSDGSFGKTVYLLLDAIEPVLHT